jgi:hypothetical protein
MFFEKQNMNKISKENNMKNVKIAILAISVLAGSSVFAMQQQYRDIEFNRDVAGADVIQATGSDNIRISVYRNLSNDTYGGAAIRPLGNREFFSPERAEQLYLELIKKVNK